MVTAQQRGPAATQNTHRLTRCVPSRTRAKACHRPVGVVESTVVCVMRVARGFECPQEMLGNIQSALTEGSLKRRKDIVLKVVLGETSHRQLPRNTLQLPTLARSSVSNPQPNLLPVLETQSPSDAWLSGSAAAPPSSACRLSSPASSNRSRSGSSRSVSMPNTERKCFVVT